MQPGRKSKDSTTPEALFIHCQTVYKEMLSRADERTGDNGLSMIVYEGILTSLILRDCNLSMPYYSGVTKALRGMGCIRQLKRGGGTAPSQWELIHEPTEELYSQFKPPRPPQTRAVQMQEQIDDLVSRVANLERIFAKVITQEGELVLDEDEGEENA